MDIASTVVVVAMKCFYLVNLVLMKIKLITLLCFITHFIYAQSDFIHKQIGNIPVLLISAHGGEYRPNFIHTRDCQACIYTEDNNTKQLMLLTSQELEKIWGISNYVYTNIHRSKIDFNRPVLEATDSTKESEIYYKSFHNFIRDVSLFMGKGLVIDFHGHNNNSKLMIGYGVPLSNTRLYWNKESFGYLFNKYYKKNSAYPPTLPAPKGYFAGGYITQTRYSNSEHIQLEFPVNMRTGNLQPLAKSLAKVIKKYYYLHYEK
jgi:hypothetical protein